jgi:hypothetical protein
MRTLMLLAITVTVTLQSDQGCLVPEGSQENNPCVYKVENAFDYIPSRTDQFFAVWADSAIESPKYQQIQSNQYKGIWGGLNHFQSIKRLPEHLGLGNYFAITGSDPIKPVAQLFIVRLDTKNTQGKLAKILINGKPQRNDRLICTLDLGKEYWHIGGIDSAGKYLAVAMSNDNDSKILFFDISDPEHLNQLKTQIDRPLRNSIAVALTRLKNGQFVLAVWTDGHKNTSRGLDFYFSRSKSLPDGFQDHHTIHIPDTAFDHFMQKQQYQNISFINDFEGNVYLVGTGNTSATAPLKAGIDHADLFLIDFSKITQNKIDRARAYDPSSIVTKLPIGSFLPHVTFIKEKHMYCKQGICNFNAGATTYVPDQQHIYIYSLPHWLCNNGTLLNFAQYAGIQRTYPD